jgi:hypothetical protein
MAFKKAIRSQAKARIAIDGPAGAGKTYTALIFASAFGKRVAVIDTERGSASKYANEFEFDVMELPSYHLQTYIDAIHEAATEGYPVLVIDSISHAWAGTGGALDMADKSASKYQGNRFAAWRDVTPLQNAFIDAMLNYPGHLIVTMRSKMEYAIIEDEKGKKVPKKMGMAPVQREGVEYEFDVVADMDMDHTFIVTKTRYRELTDVIVKKPDKAFAEQVASYLSEGQPVDTIPAKKWEGFWKAIKQAGFTEQQVHDFAQADSLKDVVHTPQQLEKLYKDILATKGQLV